MTMPTFEADGSYPVPSYEELMRSSGGWPVMPPPVPVGQVPAGAWPPGAVPMAAPMAPPAYPTMAYPPMPQPQTQPRQPKPMNHITPKTAALLSSLPAPGPRNSRQSVEHRDVTGGSLRAAVFGAMDGVVTNASLIAGATGAHSANHTIVLTGLAGLVAGAFSMATGEY